MKKIILACGSGIATSTLVKSKISRILDEAGYKGKYSITTSSVADAVKKSGNYDFCVTTTVEPSGLQCPYVSGVSFLTNRDTQASIDRIIELMNE